MSEARPLQRAIFCDRDGTLNRAIMQGGISCPPQTLEAFELLPGVPEACERLVKAGWILIVVTNQPDVGRGTQQQDIVEAMHTKLSNWLPITDIEVCYAAWDEPYCHERKPNPGMLERAATKHGIDLAQSWMIGDREKDVIAGKRAGCRCILLKSFRTGETVADLLFSTFAEAAEAILAQSKKS